MDPSGKLKAPLRQEAKNTLIRCGKTSQSVPESRYPDTVHLELYLQVVLFKDADDKVLDVKQLDFDCYDVQPTVQLRDVWRMNNVFYPRLVVTECILRERAPMAVIGFDPED